MRFHCSVGAVLAATLAAGCAVSPTSDLTAFAHDSGANSFEIVHRRVDPPETLLLPLVHDRQTSGPSCGAHALASVIAYWSVGETPTGEALYRDFPPSRPAGYSMTELTALAEAHGLLASPVRLSEEDVISELESGRPVLAPVRLPSIYVQQRGVPGGRLPLIGPAKNLVIDRAARTSEWTGLAMVDHYLLLAGYHGDSFIVVEPVMGYRTISTGKLARYREPFADAAIVFSGAPQSVASSNSEILTAEAAATVD